MLRRIHPLIAFLHVACVQALAAQSSPPLEFVQAALARHRIVFLGDIHPLAEPKVLVSRLVREQAPGAAIDLLALEFWPSRFPMRTAADAMILLRQAHPITLLAH